MRPHGRLPQQVYWVRRLVALLAVVLVITVVWWLAGRLLGDADGSEDSSGTSSTPAAADPSDDGSADEGQSDPGTDTGADPGSGQGRHDKPNHGRGDRGHGRDQQPLTPVGDCDPADVAVAVRVDDARAGAANPVTLLFRSLTPNACTLSITPSTLALRVTSGDDVIWSSDDCPDELEARQLVVQPERPLSSYAFVWNGHRSTDACTAPGKAAVAGGYWAEAALIGADAHKAYFDVR